MSESLAKLSDVNHQFQTRELANQVSGKITYLRPDEILIQNQSLGAIAASLAIFIALRETWAAFARSETNLGHTRLH
jgi:hypothetical protein